MMNSQDSVEIRRSAMEFDDAIEKKDFEKMIAAFTEDCEIQLLGIILRGKEGVRRWLAWLFTYIVQLEFKPVTIIIDGDTFFEEFVMIGTLQDGSVVESKQAEVLVYQDYKIKSLKLYFDRLDFAAAVANGFFSKRVTQMLIKRSIEGLVE
jgi:ketosteroid isomerase-like protein